MSSRDGFSAKLRERLEGSGDQVVLRVAVAQDFDHPVEFTGKELLQRAESLVRSIHPPKQRSTVLLLLPHAPELFLLQLGLVLLGHVPAILAWPTSRVDAEKYQRNLIHQLRNLPADLLLTVPRLAENIGEALPYPAFGISLESKPDFDKIFPAVAGLTPTEKPAAAGRNTDPVPDTLFLQFSGGTTGAQKAIVVTADMLQRQLEALCETLRFTAADSVVSWLPLYHDMGLVACYWLPLWAGACSFQMAAGDWVIHPQLLLKCICRHRATFCWLPNFSFSYLSQRNEGAPADLSLVSVRAFINCSEPVRLKSIQSFVAAFSGSGARIENVQASYAMAETVFAITQSELGRELRTVPRRLVKQASQSYDDRAFELIDETYVSSGRPLKDTELRIVGPDGSLCPDLVAGEIHVRTPFLFHGYWGTEGFQTHTLRDGWHATGDYGFQHQGELFVIGRFKDIAIVGGNNIFPEDVESVVNTIEGIHPGRVVAFGVEDNEYGTQSLAIVAEMKVDYDEAAALDLEAAIRKLVLATIGTAPRYVAVKPRRWIIKSTAGKISRRETRDRFLREQLPTA